ncbi:MAG: CehA/McbA family metallohydrolase [Pseudomonadota bacterium]
MRAVVLLLLLLAACAPAARDSPTDSDPLATPTFEDLLSAADGWLVGDLHTHTSYSPDGFDAVATQIAMAEALEDPAFLAAHPEHHGHGLDFLAFTDHDDVRAAADPAFASERLVLIPGAEWNLPPGEANLHGITAPVTVDGDGDGVDVDDVRALVETVHALGANLSINHPMAANYPFAWDLRTADSLEVWNTGWALSVPAADATTLADWEARHGAASPFWRRALQAHALHAGGEALVLHEAMLARGVHPAVVGGSDRHILFLPGFPATRVLVEGAADLDAVLAGVRARHTFVSRSPAGPQVLLEVDAASGRGLQGDEVPVTSGEVVTVRVGTARAPAGQLRLIHGVAVASDEALESAPLGQEVGRWDLAADGGVEHFELELEVAPGDWLYPVIVEPTVPAGLEAEREALLELARAAAAATTDFSAIAAIAGTLLDPEVFSDPGECDPADWEPLMLQCIPADTQPPGSFFVPDPLQRAFQAMTEDGEPTGWSMGAIGSAILFVSDGRTGGLVQYPEGTHNFLFHDGEAMEQAWTLMEEGEIR